MELIDIFPTINDFLGVNKFDQNVSFLLRKEDVLLSLPGKSLAPIVIGKQFIPKHYSIGRNALLNTSRSDIIDIHENMPYFQHNIAITQAWRCASIEESKRDPRFDFTVPRNHNPWNICLRKQVGKLHKRVKVMGYSLRSKEYRYTAYIHFKFKLPNIILDFDQPIYAEEFYDHREDKEDDLGKKELINLANDKSYKNIIIQYRIVLYEFLYNEVVFLNLKTLAQQFGPSNIPKSWLE